MAPSWIVLGALAVWRVTHLVHAEDGPFDIVVWLRRGAGRFGRALDCFYCLSVWIAAPFAWALGATGREQLLLWPALSAAAIVVERVTTRDAVMPTFHEEPEHVVLRHQASPARDPDPADGAPP